MLDPTVEKLLEGAAHEATPEHEAKAKARQALARLRSLYGGASPSTEGLTDEQRVVLETGRQTVQEITTGAAEAIAGVFKVFNGASKIPGL